MHLPDLHQAITSHRGTFTCERINHAPQQTKTVTFGHTVQPPLPDQEVGRLPDVGRLREFYGTFGSVVLHVDAASGDAARHIAHPDAWPQLQDAFNGWLEHLDEEERAEMVPEWLDGHCLVVGESPHTGNYILVPATAGEYAGRVFEFDHDGFEFIEQASNLVAYAQGLLDLDGAQLTDIASHMRFIGADQVQWWILEMVDNRGNRVATSL